MSSPVVLRLPVVDFKSRSRPRDTSLSDSENKEEKKREKTVATPILVDFDKLLRGPKDVKHERVLTGIPNVDLLHATAALYSVNLPEVTDDIIYTTLLEPKARTLLMVHEEKQAKLRFIRDLKDMKKVKKSSGGDDNIQPKAQATESQQSVTETTDTTDSDDYNQFANVFSDDNTEDEDEEEEEDAEDFMETIDDFLKAIGHRREKAQELAERVRSKKGKPVKPSEVTLGIEKRLFGAMTFERSYERAAQRIFVLTLIAVRKKHKKLGVGHYMLKQLRDSTVSGGADIIIVNADQSAVHFFEKEGFTDDVLINSLYSEIGDAWLNTRRMCRFSSFNGEQVTSCPDKDMRDEEDTSPPELDLKEMELQLKLWKEKSLQSYQTQALLVARMRKEIMTLRARASLQEVTAERLRRELEDTKDGVVDQKETYLRNRMESIRQAVEDFTLFGRGDVERDQQRNNEDDDFNHDPNHPGVTRKKQQAEASVEKVLIGRKAESPGTVSQSPGRQRSPSTDRRRTSSTKVDRVSPTMRPAMSSPTPQPKPARTPSLSSPKPQSQTSPRSQSPRQQSPIQQSAFSPQRGMAPKPQPQRSSSVVGRSSSAAGKPFIPRPVAATSLDARQKWAVSEQMADFARREIEHCFKTSMDGDGTAVPTQVMSIEPAQPTDEMYAKFDTKVREAHSPDIVGELYFCAKEGGASDARLHHVTNFGFSDFDFAESAYGRGLHFTRYARTAARYSPPNKVLVAKVLLGRTKTVTEKDEARTDAPAGCDSILTQGRMSTIATKPGRQYRPGCSEYIVFHPDQALPVAVIKYAADGAST